MTQSRQLFLPRSLTDGGERDPACCKWLLTSIIWRVIGILLKKKKKSSLWFYIIPLFHLKKKKWICVFYCSAWGKHDSSLQMLHREKRGGGGGRKNKKFILPAELTLCLQLKWKCRLKSVSSLSQLFSFQISLDLCFSPNDPQLIAVRCCILCTVNRCCQELICKYTFPCFMYCAEKSQYIKPFCLYTTHFCFLF